ncbi:MAG: P-II family nitrogen regulator [Fimbriimonadaceae bacterium]|nr:P-II family nitrogen regulator [Fimbriimonadaceae bacterium]
MKRITCIIRPHFLEAVKSAIANLGVSGMSVADVRGVGSTAPSETRYGNGTIIAMPIRSRIEVVVPDAQVESVISTILEAARTGQMDDGKIFVEAVTHAIRIRTQDTGDDAL